MLSSDSAGIRRARNLRGNLSLPEGLLWRELRKRPGDFKFRRQHPAGPYTLDFYCDRAKLCVEVDGISHDMGANPPRDLERDAWLAQRDVRVLRLPAILVLRDMPAALATILAACTPSSP